MKSFPLIIAIVVGESSGDILGAALIRKLKLIHPNSKFIGVAGPMMRREGCNVLYNMESLSVMGITDVFKKIPSLLKIYNYLIKNLIISKPSVFIGIDFPDFNIRLAGRLKKFGIITVHYVSPSIWAWRKNRIYKIARNIDLMLVFLPFEKEIYDNFNINCRFIGHTTADSIPLHPDKIKIRNKLGIKKNALYLALLPGSRMSEINMLSANFLIAIKFLIQKYPKLEILVPLVNKKIRDQFKKIQLITAPKLPIHLFNGQSKEILIASDIALLASGTATLECMLAKCPMVVGYKMSFLNFLIAKILIKTPYISLPNILAGREIVKEMIQSKCQPKSLALALQSILSKNQKKRNDLLNIFLQFHKMLRCNADHQAAIAILDIIYYTK